LAITGAASVRSTRRLKQPWWYYDQCITLPGSTNNVDMVSHGFPREMIYKWIEMVGFPHLSVCLPLGTAHKAHLEPTRWDSWWDPTSVPTLKLLTFTWSTVKHQPTDIHTRWCPPVISWFINHSN
jgi:hypothetical protein